MNINAVWYKKHKLKIPTTLVERVKWHEAHLKHCGCPSSLGFGEASRKNVPPTILTELKNQGKQERLKKNI